MAQRQVITTLAVTVAIALLGGAAFAQKQGSGSKSGMGGSSSSMMDSGVHNTDKATVTNESSSTSGYKNGTYTIYSNYTSPGGSQQIKVSLTLKDGAISDSSVVSESQDYTSKSYQSDFIGAYKQAVTGKNISTISGLSRIGGSSLTTAAFDNAVTKIANQAKA